MSAMSLVYLILVDLSKLDFINSIFPISADDVSSNGVEIISKSFSFISCHMHQSSGQPTLILRTTLQIFPPSKVPCNKHVIIMGIAGMPEIPIDSHNVDIALKNIYSVHVISLEFTGKPHKSYRNIHKNDFPTFNVGYPHSIKVY